MCADSAEAALVGLAARYLGAPVTASSERPYPPYELASRVRPLDEYSDPYRYYEELGAQMKRALLELLPDDWSFDGKRVLDFGSGAGRSLRHFLSEAERGEFWGADIDRASIEWMEAALCPPLHAWRCGHRPPLGLEHRSFDLAWAISVFTHLTDESLPWLLELHRLLKPGGLLIASYYGRWNSEQLAGEPWEPDRNGMNVLGHNVDWDLGGPSVLISDWWVRAHWGRAFEILEIEPQVDNMSWALMRRRDVRLTVADLERPADDPREYLSARHNLRQVQREVERATAGIEQLRRGYEQSRSWRVTRPLRAAARLLGRRGSGARARPEAAPDDP
jgi:SAM-dependent methyltransferase